MFNAPGHFFKVGEDVGKVGVIIAAAGQGSRMGESENKIFLPLEGIPVLVRSIKNFKQPWIDEIVVVGRSDEQDKIRTLLDRWKVSVDKVVVGGARRQDSVEFGLKALSEKVEWVFIHDGARPLVTEATILESFKQVQRHQAVGVGVPVKDTIKVIDSNNYIINTPKREQLWAIQTPQAFSYELIKNAYAEANLHGWEVTDDCSLVEKIGAKVKMIQGENTNIKITTPEDLEIATMFLNKMVGGLPMRTGIGYDVHRFADDRPLILAGIQIDHARGLSGHSDADVATHALMDSLLGAAGLGDIGRHFPDSDPEYKGISSILLLERVVNLLAKKQYRINNVDLTIIAQKPKLAPYIDQMRASLSKIMAVDLDAINVKATTTEGLGFCGREEGIAAMAVATIVK